MSGRLLPGYLFFFLSVPFLSIVYARMNSFFACCQEEDGPDEESEEDYADNPVEKKKRKYCSKPKHSCDLCDYKDTSKKRVNMHKLSAHPGVRFPCTQCDYEAALPGTLNVHMQTHKGFRYKCDLCDFKAGLSHSNSILYPFKEFLLSLFSRFYMNEPDSLDPCDFKAILSH